MTNCTVEGTFALPGCSAGWEMSDLPGGKCFAEALSVTHHYTAQRCPEVITKIVFTLQEQHSPFQI